MEDGSSFGRSLAGWFVRKRRWVASLLAAFLLYTLAGFFLVPWIIERQIREQATSQLNREATVRDVAFNPFTLAATIDGLQLNDLDRTALVTVDRLRLDLQVSGIFRRAWRFREITIDRPVVAARLMSDGRPSVADLVESSPSSQPSDGPIELPRVIVDRFVLGSGVVQFSDASRQPLYESRFEPINLNITDLITIPEEGGSHTIAIGVGDGAVLRWTGRQVVEPLQFTGELAITGLELDGLWDYFGKDRPLAVREGRIDLTLPYRVRRGDGRSFQANLDDATLSVRSLNVRPRDGAADWLSVPELRATGIDVHWPESVVEVASVTTTAPRVLASLDETKTLNWTRAFPASGTKPAEPSPWTVRVASVAVDRGAADFEDRSVDPPVALSVSDLAIRANQLSSALATAVPFTASGRFQEDGTFDVSGSVAPSPLALDLRFDGKGLDVAVLSPYVRLAPGARLATAKASMRGQASLASDGKLALSGGGDVSDVELRDLQGNRVAAWGSMAVQGLTLADPPVRARIRNIVFDRAFARIHIDKAGNLNLTRLFAGEPSASADRTAQAAEPARVEVGTIQFRDGSAEFTDESIIFDTFNAQIHSLNGSIRDVSSFAAAPATIGLEGRVDTTGFVKVGGTLRLANPMASSEVTVAFRSIDMLGLTPYVAEFAGYRVKSGVLDLDVRYQVKDRRLLGNHTLVARDLGLGDRVKDSKGPGFAVRLAVALLKDREGRINLDIPIEGTVDSPEFGYRKVFWAAVRTILGNAAKAPFRALGRLFGRDEDDLELVEFDPGRGDLLPAEQDKLARLAEQLAPRQDLTVAIEGRFDPKSDVAALKRIKLDALIESRRSGAAAAAAAADASTIETILEALFTERFDAAQLQAERAKFTTAAPPQANAGAPAVAPAPSAPAAPAAPAPSAPAAPAATQPAPAAPAAFDAAAFYESLRAKLLEAQEVAPADLDALATSRAAAIRTALTAGGALTDARMAIAKPATVKRNKAGSSRIASELTLSAGEEGED